LVPSSSPELVKDVVKLQSHLEGGGGGSLKEVCYVLKKKDEDAVATLYDFAFESTQHSVYNFLHKVVCDLIFS
jgi:hypothetical protein